MINAILQYSLYLIILIILAIPLGKYIGKVMNGERVFLSKVIVPIENLIYRLFGVDEEEEMGWKKYSISILVFSAIGFIVLFLLNIFQGFLPLNPEGVQGTSVDLAFNTTSSFITNTNWQAYSGESQLSYLTQMLGLTVQNFLSAGTGIAVLFALIRGFVKSSKNTLGNFWVDLTKSVLYILMPLSVVISLLLVSQGVVQNFNSYEEVSLLQEVILEDGSIVNSQVIPQGPAASQVAIKQLGTNGGGFFGVNSAHPLENPTAFSNLVEMISILLIPAALCFTFGRNIKDKKQGKALFLAMFILLVTALVIIGVSEAKATPQLLQNGQVDIGFIDQGGGNMEGKEARFGVVGSSTWAAFTTAASNGSVNSMHDSFTPIGGMMTMLLIQLGEVIFGGVGCGLYGMIAFAIITVFIAGLMVGRTPEYLCKKIEPYEMKMAMLVCLATPLCILIGSALASLNVGVTESLNNSGAHGFSEVLYAYSSAGGNNGSAFAGFAADTVFINLSIGLIMLLVRFVPMFATLAIAGSLVKKKKVAISSGTLPTHNALFIGLLIFVVLLIGALSFFPALALGPIAEFLQMI
ncbi:potassium-transporting ATPase subunit KdpA [Clostridium sp. B9]|uniref:potassium-transporting ATPase subunit KdpA n=1 Tax=Clostridium sp. B9 TaxID=3423224 RepID=UPI003D2EF13D